MSITLGKTYTFGGSGCYHAVAIFQDNDYTCVVFKEWMRRKQRWHYTVVHKDTAERFYTRR